MEELKRNRKRIALEKRVLNLSVAGSLAFMILEGVMAYLTGSHSILMDCVFDTAELILVGPFLVLIPLLYKPVTEERPYGFSQVESLFLLIKYGILLVITLDLIFENIGLIMHGGHLVDAGAIALFELAVCFGCVVLYLVLCYFSKKYSSVTIQAELYAWKLDILSSMGVALAFGAQILLQQTAYGWISPYVDPLVAIVLSVLLLIEPIRVICQSIKNLVLFAPSEEVMDEIRTTVSDIMKEYPYHMKFLDVIQTGRKTWVEIYIYSQTDTVYVKNLQEIRNEIRNKLRGSFDQIYVEIIPELKQDGWQTTIRENTCEESKA
ncbi:MAG: cation diffusion facilitator family transporter [Lachnospiraceae bacterium]|nr:cation diffusion facilitator family transporter [Lachnospiraceae bacterium]